MSQRSSSHVDPSRSSSTSPPGAADSLDAPFAGPSLSRLGQAALAYAKIGWAVFPLSDRTKKPFSKHHACSAPLHQHAVTDATIDSKMIRAWWTAHPEANVAAACGTISGISVLDVDIKEWEGKHGDRTLKMLTDQHGELEMLHQRTWSGGVQYIGTYDSRAAKTSGAYGEWLDGRNDGNYIVVPPSVVSEGARTGEYKWLKAPFARPLTPFPEWLLVVGEHAGSEKKGAPKEKGWEQDKITGVKLGMRDESLLSLLGKYTVMRPPLSQEEVLRLLLAAGATYVPPAEPQEIREKVERLFEKYSTHELIRYPFTDTGNAERMVYLYGDRFRWLLDIRDWRAWDGGRWAPGSQEQVRKYAADAARQLQANGLRIEGDHPGLPKKKTILMFALASEDAKDVTNAVMQAKDQPSVWTKLRDFDRHHDLLNVGNGTLDLRTFTLKPHDPNDYFSMITPVEYDPAAAAPNWLTFLKTIFLGKQDVIDYIQRAVGYTLTGSIEGQCLFMLHGGGDNAKSTFVEVLTALFGEYAVKVVDDALLMSERVQKRGATPELLALVGKRFAYVDEMNQGASLDEARIKALTGSARGAGRQLYTKQSEWVNTAKLWFDLNALPDFKGVDFGIQRRFHVVPFDWVVPKEQKKENYAKDVLLPELPGILAWAVEGCRLWRERGMLDPPEAVTVASRQYTEEHNHLPAFFEECYEKDAGGRVDTAVIKETYAVWCKARDDEPMSFKDKVSRYLKDVYRVKPSKSGRVRQWVGLKPKKDGVAATIQAEIKLQQEDESELPF